MNYHLHPKIKAIVLNLLEEALDECRLPGHDPCEIREDDVNTAVDEIRRLFPHQWSRFPDPRVEQ